MKGLNEFLNESNDSKLPSILKKAGVKFTMKTSPQLKKGDTILYLLGRTLNSGKTTEAKIGTIKNVYKNDWGETYGPIEYSHYGPNGFKYDEDEFVDIKSEKLEREHIIVNIDPKDEKELTDIVKKVNDIAPKMDKSWYLF